MTEQTAIASDDSAAGTSSALRQVKPSYVELANVYMGTATVGYILLANGDSLKLVEAACKEIQTGLNSKAVQVTPRLDEGPNGYSFRLQVQRTDGSYVSDPIFMAELMRVVNPTYRAKATGRADIRFDQYTPAGIYVTLTVTDGKVTVNRNDVNAIDGVHRSRIITDHNGRTVIKFSLSAQNTKTAFLTDTVQEKVDEAAAKVADALGLHIVQPIKVNGIDDESLLFLGDETAADDGQS